VLVLVMCCCSNEKPQQNQLQQRGRSTRSAKPPAVDYVDNTDTSDDERYFQLLVHYFIM